MDPVTLPPKPVIWTLDASDACGLTSAQLDTQVSFSLGVHCCTLTTARLASTGKEHKAFAPVPLEHLEAELNCLAVSMPPAVIKLGLLPNAEVVHLVADVLEDFNGYVVYEPVFTLAGGLFQLDRKVWELIRRRLLPQVDIFLPSCKQLASLTGAPVDQYEDIEKASEQFLHYGVKSLLIKAGQLVGDPRFRDDFFYGKGGRFWLRNQGVSGKPAIASGAVMAAAIAASLAHGLDIEDALVIAESCRNQCQRQPLHTDKGTPLVGSVGWPDVLEDMPLLITDNPERWSRARLSVEKVEGLGMYPVVGSSAAVEHYLSMGVRTLQLRLPALAEPDLKQEVQRSVKLCSRYGARLFVAGHWQLALLYGAFGVHLEQADIGQANMKAISDGGLQLGLGVANWSDLAEALAISPGYIAIEFNGELEGFTHRLQHWVELLAGRFSLTVQGEFDAQSLPAILSTGVGSASPLNDVSEGRVPLDNLLEAFGEPSLRSA